MFEGLDQIDWGNIDYPVYRDSKRIPNAIRNLLSQNPDVRNEARASLLGWGQEYGDITKITSHIIPFIFEVLNNPDAPGKADLLDHLASVARGIWESEHLPITMMHLYVETYDSLKAGLDILISLLDDNASVIRLGAIEVLQYLTGEVKVLLPEFMRCFHDEKEEDVQVAFLKGLKILLRPTGWEWVSFEEKCKPFLNEIVETNSSPRIQIAAAQVSVEIFKKHVTDGLSPKVGNLLANHFWKISKMIDNHGWSEEFDSALMVIKDLAQLDAADLLIKMIHNPDITPVQAHLIARGLLSLFTGYSDNAYWNCHRNYYFQDREFDYLHSFPQAHNIKFYVQRRDDYERRFISLLEAIVENSRFWELPTNMISFFIGLPDSREQLRAILNSNGSE